MHKGTILITGCAGFIGSNLTDKLLALGYRVAGVDNFNDYYDPKIKYSNLEIALPNKKFKLYREDVLNYKKISDVFSIEKPGIVIHLAARAGVRPSLENPKLYTEVNVLGTVNLLKLSVDSGVKKFIFGSSSSVYGNSPKIPFDEEDNCENIISPYGASKRAAEFFVESFHHTFGLKSTILRFFTVYGPRGRVDMAPALFTKALIRGTAINQFGDGSSSRDYTYIGDVINGITKTIEKDLGFETINLGNNKPITLNEFIETLEIVTGKQARIKKMPKQTGDVLKTWANISKARKLLGWQPEVSVKTGVLLYYKWLLANNTG